MDKFDNISGGVGSGDYTEFSIDKKDATDFTDAEIKDLESQGYEKSFWYSKEGSKMNALFSGELDPEETEAMGKQGYILEKNMIKYTSVPISECSWIGDIIDGNTTMTFFFPYDRYSNLDHQKKKLVKKDPIKYQDVFDFIDEFYNGNLSRKELKLLKNTNDVFEYYKLAQDAYKNKTDLKRKEVMGEAVRFEGFDEYGNILLGS